MHMVAARLGFEKAMVDTGRATARPDCMDRLRKHFPHLAEGWFLVLWLCVGVWQPIVLTITCSLMSGCGQSHKTAH